MVSTSKILTVSYGTFSCTLEGFDDSFDTMKAIAEYFRDLAAEDRYFGAEPPVPDAEMLARIAEREIARRVEAREERGSIVLRAAPFGAMAAPLAPLAAAPAPVAKTAPEPAPLQPAAAETAPAETVAADTTTPTPADPPVTESAQTVQDAPTAPAVTTPPAPAAPLQASALPAATPHVAPDQDEWEDIPSRPQPASANAALRPTPVPHPDPDSVAAKLQRIRDVVSKSAAATAAQSYSEDEHAESFLTETTSGIETALDIDDQTDQAMDEDDSDEIAALLNRLTREDAEPAPAEEVAEDPLPDNAQEMPQDTVPAQDDATEDAALDATAAHDATADTPEDTAPKADRPIGRVLAIKRASFNAAVARGDLIALPDDAAANAPQDPAAAARDDDDQDAAVSAPETSPETAPDAASVPDLPPASDLSPEDEEALRLELAQVEAELGAGAFGADAQHPLNDDSAYLDDHADAAAFDDDATTAAFEDMADDVDGYDDGYDDAYDDEDEDEDDLASIFEDDEDEDDRDQQDAALREAVLKHTAADDADHQGQTADSTASDDLAASRDDGEPALTEHRDDSRERLVQTAAEDDMSRLMAKAETALTAPESANRRSAIAHLRAAVAAIKAEKSAGVITTKPNATEAFRDDLADVVRPRRPVGDAATATPRPSEPRPAPLKLVAEQRVDLPDSRSAAPVRPRRVSLAGAQRPEPQTASSTASDPATASTKALADDGFSAFARQMGATTLPDLIEAAAAYLVDIEDRDAFSRAQLMTKARQASDGDFNREDGLRAFGQLLRQGKITKLRGGAFAVTEDIGFRPGARRVG